MVGLLAGLGCRAEPEALRDAYRAGWQQAEVVRATGIDVSSREQVVLFLDALDPALRPALSPGQFQAIADEYAEGLVSWPPDAVPGAAEALAACRAAGTRTALVSNTGSTPGRVLRRTLRTLGLAEYLDVWVFSDEIRLSKPVPAIFKHTLAALHTDPAETLFVGDTPELDVIGAKAAGMWMLQLGLKSGPGPRADLRAADLRGFVAALHRAGLQLAPARI